MGALLPRVANHAHHIPAPTLKQDTRSKEAKEAHEAFEDYFWGGEARRALGSIDHRRISLVPRSCPDPSMPGCGRKMVYIALCPNLKCLGEGKLVPDANFWSVKCGKCGHLAEPDTNPNVAVKNWNAEIWQE